MNEIAGAKASPDLPIVSPERCGIILLAAGGSTRLGGPKKLLPYRGQSLIRHAISVALASRARPVIVVLGAGHESISNEIADLAGIHVIVNDRWQEGIASSIRAGLSRLPEIAACGMAILAVCDQPLISPALFNQLIDRQAEGNYLVVACAYGDTLGTPALFHRRLFDQLLSLTGDMGAKRIIAENPGHLATVAFPGGERDIDTR